MICTFSPLHFFDLVFCWSFPDSLCSSHIGLTVHWPYQVYSLLSRSLQLWMLLSWISAWLAYCLISFRTLNNYLLLKKAFSGHFNTIAILPSMFPIHLLCFFFFFLAIITFWCIIYFPYISYLLSVSLTTVSFLKAGIFVICCLLYYLLLFYFQIPEKCLIHTSAQNTWI